MNRRWGCDVERHGSNVLHKSGLAARYLLAAHAPL